jgi:hypothetical protein
VNKPTKATRPAGGARRVVRGRDRTGRFITSPDELLALLKADLENWKVVKAEVPLLGLLRRLRSSQ